MKETSRTSGFLEMTSTTIKDWSACKVLASVIMFKRISHLREPPWPRTKQEGMCTTCAQAVYFMWTCIQRYEKECCHELSIYCNQRSPESTQLTLFQMPRWINDVHVQSKASCGKNVIICSQLELVAHILDKPIVSASWWSFPSLSLYAYSMRHTIAPKYEWPSLHVELNATVSRLKDT